MTQFRAAVKGNSEGPEPLQRDWGLLYGYGVFETIRVYEGMPFDLDRHLNRMTESARHLKIVEVPSLQWTQDITAEATKFARDLKNGLIRITLTGGNPEMGMPSRLLLAARAVTYTPADQSAGIDVTFADTPRNERSPLVRYKTLNQLENILAYRAGVKRGYHETIFLNLAGNIAEASRSNVFMVRRGKVVTPSLRCGILPGITRQHIIEIARRLGYVVQERPISKKELLDCDECFLSNAHMEVMPVAVIDRKKLRSAKSFALTAELIGAYREDVLIALRRLQDRI